MGVGSFLVRRRGDEVRWRAAAAPACPAARGLAGTRPVPAFRLVVAPRAVAPRAVSTLWYLNTRQMR